MEKSRRVGELIEIFMATQMIILGACKIVWLVCHGQGDELEDGPFGFEVQWCIQVHVPWMSLGISFA